MGTVKVRPKPGRRAFYEGKELVQDKWTQVNETATIVRLRDYWGDIEQEGFTPPETPPVGPNRQLPGAQAQAPAPARPAPPPQPRGRNPEAKE